MDGQGEFSLLRPDWHAISISAFFLKASMSKGIGTTRSAPRAAIRAVGKADTASGGQYGNKRKLARLPRLAFLAFP